jgi:hypothetical protein
MPIVGFGEWLPDLPPFENTGSIYVNNVVPVAGGNYAPWYAFTPIDSSALDSSAIGAISARAKNGTVNTFAGTRTKLFRSTTGAFSDATRTVGGAYTAQIGDYWRFAKFGDVMIATDFQDDMQQFNMTSSTNFSVLTGFPKARFLAASKDFLFFGNVSDPLDGLRPERVGWSQLRTLTYSPGTNLSDNNDLLGDGGDVTGLLVGSYLTVMQEKAVWRADFTGDANIPFSFVRLESTQGNLYPNAPVQYGDISYFISQDGFCRSNGQVIQIFGSGKVNKYFNDTVNKSFLSRVYGAVDILNQLIIWIYPSVSSSGVPDKAIMYYITEDRFSQGDVAVDVLFSTLTRDISIDAISGSLDALGEISLDSGEFSGGRYRLGAFNSSNQLCYPGTATLAASIVGSEQQINPGGRAFLRGLRVNCDATPQSVLGVTIGTRNDQGATISYGSTVSPSVKGHFPLRADGRYHRVKVDIQAGSSWTKLQGVSDIDAKKSGAR